MYVNRNGLDQLSLGGMLVPYCEINTINPEWLKFSSMNQANMRSMILVFNMNNLGNKKFYHVPKIFETIQKAHQKIFQKH